MRNICIATKTPIIYSVLLLCFSTNNAAAKTTTDDKIFIPVVENAKVFAQFDDKSPAVINYFSTLSESDIVDFYVQSYGKVKMQERKRGRLTLSFINGSEKIRVVISPQNNAHQVDVIVEK